MEGANYQWQTAQTGEWERNSKASHSFIVVLMFCMIDRLTNTPIHSIEGRGYGRKRWRERQSHNTSRSRHLRHWESYDKSQSRAGEPEAKRDACSQAFIFLVKHLLPTVQGSKEWRHSLLAEQLWWSTKCCPTQMRLHQMRRLHSYASKTCGASIDEIRKVKRRRRSSTSEEDESSPVLPRRVMWDETMMVEAV